MLFTFLSVLFVASNTLVSLSRPSTNAWMDTGVTLQKSQSPQEYSKLSKIFPQPPMVAFKQPNSLRNLLVRAKISKPNTTIGKSHSCGDKRCKCCIKHVF
jgi:hypothetical protein